MEMLSGISGKYFQDFPHFPENFRIIKKIFFAPAGRVWSLPCDGLTLLTDAYFTFQGSRAKARLTPLSQLPADLR